MTSATTPLAAIVFTGGINHPFDDAAPTLAGILEESGFRVRVSQQLDEVLAALRVDREALLVNYALRWSMTQDEKYEPHRQAWALHLSGEAREVIAAHVRGGAGLLGVHTASICFDDWPQWRDVLGGAWVWGKSWHPLPGPASVTVNAEHELTSGLTDFSIRDEVYCDLNRVPDVQVAAWARAELPGDARQTGTQPALWSHRFGRGRVVYDALGHDSQSLNHPVHRVLLQRAALWACGLQSAERISCAM